MTDIADLSKEQLLERKRQVVKDISKYKNLQLAKKVQLNSAYGAVWKQILPLLRCEESGSNHTIRAVVN